MADSEELVLLNKERLTRLSRSSICDISSFISNPSPELFKRIIIDKGNELVTDKLIEGDVTVHFTNGNTYTGSIVNGVLHGLGRLDWANGTSYEGEFKDGCITGKGEYNWKDGSRYVGGVRDGLRHGNGTFYHASGKYVYSGDWVDGIKTGQGKMIFNGDESSFYEGAWSNNQQNGHGIRRYKSGNYYEGEWYDSHRHGNGMMHWVTQGEKYNGQWKEGIQHGQGEHVWFMNTMGGDNSQYPLSNRYNGQWVEGVREGQGTFHYASGGRFEGAWHLNKKQGPGKYYLPNGQVIEGIYRDDKLVTPRLQGDTKGNILSTLRPKTPLGSLIGDIDGSGGVGSTTRQFNVGVACLIPSTDDVDKELEKVHSVVLRYLTQLKRSYHYYSSLDMTRPSNYGDAAGSRVLKRIQLWQMFADFKLHTHCITLTEVDNLIQKAVSKADSDDVNASFLMREFLQCVVFVADSTYSESSLSSRLDRFMQKDFVPNTCQVKGLAFQYIESTSLHLKWIIEWYKETRSISTNSIATFRDFILFTKNHGIVGELSVANILDQLVTLQPLIATDEYSYNLNIPMNMLEFYDAIVACAIHWYNCKEEESNHLQEDPTNNCSPLQCNDSDRAIEQGTLSSNGDINEEEGAEGSRGGGVQGSNGNTPTADLSHDDQERKVTFGDEKAVAITDGEEETTSDNTELDSAKENDDDSDMKTKLVENGAKAINGFIKLMQQ